MEVDVVKTLSDAVVEVNEKFKIINYNDEASIVAKWLGGESLELDEEIEVKIPFLVGVSGLSLIHI